MPLIMNFDDLRNEIAMWLKKIDIDESTILMLLTFKQ